MKIIITERQFKSLILEQVGCDVFSNDVTAQDYDDILRGEENRYLKNVTGKIIMMTPNEYYDRCAQMQGTSIEDQRKFTIGHKVDSLIRAIEKGNKLALPYLDYSSMQQEGRHRVGAAERYGCKVVPVAVFYKNGQDDPYYNGWNGEGDYSIPISDMFGKWPDLKKDDKGDVYIEFNPDNSNDYRVFLNLYPDFDTKFDLFNYVTRPYSSKLGSDDFMKVFDYDVHISEEIPELNSFIMKTINAGVNREDLYNAWDDKEYVDRYLDNTNHFHSIYYILKSIATLGMKKEIVVSDNIIKTYEAINKMINTVYTHLYLYHNSQYFSNDIDKSYRVDIDNHNKMIRLYCDGRIQNFDKYKSAKEYLFKEKVKITEDIPKEVQNRGMYVIPKKLVQEYIKIHRG